ncbi:MAG: zinc carboxypeptidase [Candidatus Cyclonatronum sp.]|uniref:M14 family zinc carboxypeptidase n=1 Tax=Cyclonatronum sp. TaxID=3024185 RepID=UPI0025BA3ABB|nr:M14 family zinc carboxypeptidase [Cyclonatronum sp.]MCH8487293.1 zinc carboxypeptidase [Cyclonatronum sp.]
MPQFLRVAFAALLMLLITAVPCHAQTGTHVFARDFAETRTAELSFFLPDDVSYNPAIPTPKEVLGFNIGEWHLRHDLMVRYMEALAQASDRITLEFYGRSHELRPLLLLTITHPENHGRIDAIREQHVQLSDPQRSGDLDLSQMPAVVWLGYSVHGNEHSGVNAGVLAAYYYAAAEGEAVETLLRESVILLDPSFNPDGQDRFVSWVNSHRNLNRLTADPANREFNEPWPRSRTNHYWFDLNRDWMPLQHPESRYRLEMFHHWKPNVLTDHHEMGTNATYFFQPGVPSRNNPLTPERNYELTGKLAEFHAAYLDEIGQLYYSRETFDDFYVGKGSTYPDFFGTIGILFEQASSRGHIQESQHGLLSFPETILNQFLTSLSTVAGTHALREDFHAFKRDYFRSALEEARRDEVKAWVFGAEHDPARMYHLSDILLRHQLSFYQLNRDITVRGQTFRAGRDFIIPTEQPNYRMVRSLFETRTTFTDSLFYDVSTWSLPHSFDLQHAELNSRMFGSNLLGEQVQAETLAFPTGTVHGGQARFAYIFEWDGYYAPRALNDLLRHDIRAKVANREFTLPAEGGDRSFARGSVMIPVGIQDACSPDELYAMIQEAARENAVDFYAVNTGLARSGIDLGSPSFSSLRKPEVLLLVGDGVNVSEAGETWFQLDQRYNVPVSMVETDRFDRLDLSRYNTIVLPNGNYNRISASGRENLSRWLNSGGVIIAYKSAINWLVRHDLASAEFKTVSSSRAAGEMIAYEDAGQLRGAQVIGGSIFRTRADLSHPLLYGYRNPELSVFRNSTLFLAPPQNAHAAPLRYTRQPLVSGYVSPQNLQTLPGTASLMVSGSGQGRVVMFADNPNFRAFWFGTNKLFANSLFFGHTISGVTIER